MTTPSLSEGRDDDLARPSGQALVSDEAPAGLHPSGFDPSREDDWNTVWANRPEMPSRNRIVLVSVVGRRCVYLCEENGCGHRIAGGKPYVSENLPSFDHKTTLGDVLDAFTEKEIRAALREKRRDREYFAAYHAGKKAREAVSDSDGSPKGEDACGSVADDSAAIAQNPAQP